MTAPRSSPDSAVAFEQWFLKFSSWGLSHEALVRASIRTPGSDLGDVVYTSPSGSCLTRHMCSLWINFYGAAQAGWNASRGGVAQGSCGPVAWSLVWPGGYGVNTETTFKTEDKAAGYASRCGDPKPVIVPLYAKPPAAQAAPSDAVREALELARKRIEYFGEITTQRHQEANEQYFLPPIDNALAALTLVSSTDPRGSGK